MPDFEPPSIVETGVRTESERSSEFRTIAEQIGGHTKHTLENAKNISKQFLEKTWYSHSTSLFYLESVVIKSLSLLYPELRAEGKMLGVGLSLAGFSTNVDNVVKKLTTKIPVGEHMDVIMGRFRSIKNKELSDGSVVKPGSKVGVIHFTRNLPIMDKQSNVAFSRQLFRSGEESLNNLAGLCEANDPRLEGVEFFYGWSHLAGPIAKRLGFDVFDIANPIRRLGPKFVNTFLAGGLKDTPTFQRINYIFKTPREAFISRQKLVELYGSTTKQDVS